MMDCRFQFFSWCFIFFFLNLYCSAFVLSCRGMTFVVDWALNVKNLLPVVFLRVFDVHDVRKKTVCLCTCSADLCHDDRQGFHM